MRAWLPLSLSLLFLAGCDTGSTPPDSTGPKRVTLVTEGAAAEGDGVELASGAIIAGGGDLRLYQAMVLSLASPAPESLCVKGKVAALSDVPADMEACPGAASGEWTARLYLGGATLHTSEQSDSIGLGALVWDEEHTVLYRLRMIGDSYDEQGVSTATFDYEAAPE